MKTNLSIQGDKFLVNNRLIYSELPNSDPRTHGLMMNARMIQGVFDDWADPSRFNRFGRVFDPERNTDELIAALPAWYEKGLRAITVGFQGGGACFTIDSYTVCNNPYSRDGLTMDDAYLARMKRLILAADELGMIVIVSLLYGAQSRFLEDDCAVEAAVVTASTWLKNEGFTNVIIEVANEHDIPDFKRHPVVYTDEGAVRLLHLAREASGLPVGCSKIGGGFGSEICRVCDVILLHGNDIGAQSFYGLIKKARSVSPQKPIVFNEDSPTISRLAIAVREGVSWGYFNGTTKQEPPTDWRITGGEDFFFAARMNEFLHPELSPVPPEKQFYLQGLEYGGAYNGQRWIRLAALYPELINHVDFLRNGEFVGRAYEEPFMLNSMGSNWNQAPFSEEIMPGEAWEARIHLHNGEIVSAQATAY